jgi:hypothetical protein
MSEGGTWGVRERFERLLLPRVRGARGSKGSQMPTAHDPCIELDVGRGRCLDGELNGSGYCDMFVVGKIDRRMFQRAVYAILRWGRCSSMMKASTLCAISAGSAALCLASTSNVVCAAINTAMVISSGWSLKNLPSCSDNACKALSQGRTIRRAKAMPSRAAPVFPKRMQ